MSKKTASNRAQRGRPEMSSDQRALMRRRISEIAKTLFQEEGYDKISMRRIAREIGCNPMTIYGYYPAKIDILRTLWGDVFETLFDRLEAIPKSREPHLYLRNLCVAYVRYWIENPDYYRLVFMAEGVTQPDVSLFLDNPDIVTRYTLFSTAIQNLDRKTHIHDHTSKLDFLISAMHGVAHNNVTISGYPWSSCETQIHYAIHGIL